MSQLKTAILKDACYYGHLEMVKYLISINTPFDEEAIFWAKTKEIEDLLKTYLDKRTKET